MKKAITLLVLAAFVLGALACSEKVSKPKSKDPLEALTYDYLRLIKEKKMDEAYNMFSAETRKFYKKEQFLEDAASQIAPKVDFVYVTKIEKRKLDATIFTEFKPNTTWATYNSLEQAKIKLDFVYQDGKWWIQKTDEVAKGQEEDSKEKARLARVAEWAPFLKYDFKAENKVTDEGPTLVFHGEIENTRDKPVNLVMLMANFYDAKGTKVYNIVVTPIYVSGDDPKHKPLEAKSKQKIVESIWSQIPDTWSGKFDFSVFDAGDMPEAQ